ncbi:MAG: aminotransferase class I/II-fold pyridoxal phosphate-dependent enzyme [Candidatus Thalassarchaeaceae archaeon]|jgi:cystathionine beta-lyase/cystathionine gamma-synthase|nr:aminotransferase class I/II-fold pyridoxal phosphate-dependent enzyme [Candidatus Thalassarchaeaceae archaeon]|tara:strand:- start:2912 stop:4111 length:1200 start_codon:yes stop_codon:yes gene_type:complete
MEDKFADRSFDTRAVWSGTNNIEGSATTPAFLTSTYQLTEERYRSWMDKGGQHTLLYSRYSSVNSEAVSAKIASLEGAEDGETFASGMAAISSTLFSLLSQDDHIVTSADIYGGTYGLMTSELPRYGIEVTMADMRDPSSFEAAIKENTKVLYVETITNPVLKVCDLDAMAALAKKHGIISIVDNTFATPWACKPISLGFDLVINSGTKFLNGHTDLTAGFVVGRADLIERAFHFKTRFGGSADPHMCYLLERGMRTLHARMPIHVSNAAELAQRLEGHPMIASVNHPSLQSSADFQIAQRIVPKGTGMLSFAVKGGDEAAMAFVGALEIVFEATSLGGVESLVECPFNTSHMFVPEEVRIEAGIAPGFVRMSVGIEDVEDLWSDIDQALEAAEPFLGN